MTHYPMTAPEPRPSVPPDRDWLIERGQPERQSPTVWWCGNQDWSEDANKAVRFESKESAEAVIASRTAYVGKAPFGRATSHIWLAVASPLPEEPPKALPVAILEALRDEAVRSGVIGEYVTDAKRFRWLANHGWNGAPAFGLKLLREVIDRQKERPE